MRRRFADGRWPALFRFRRNDLSPTGRRTGIVLVADDLKPAEITELGLLAESYGFRAIWAQNYARERHGNIQGVPQHVLEPLVNSTQPHALLMVLDLPLPIDALRALPAPEPEPQHIFRPVWD